MFCKAGACSNPPIQGLSAITAQGVYCISTPGAPMRKGICRIFEIYAITWAELFPDGRKQGAVLHGHNPTPSQQDRSSPLHLSSLPTRSPFGSGKQSSRQAGLCQACFPLGRNLSQLGGEDSVRGEKEAFSALSVLQQCQMYWSWASQLHWADGTEQRGAAGSLGLPALQRWAVWWAPKAS